MSGLMVELWLDDERDPKAHGWHNATWIKSAEKFIERLRKHLADYKDSRCDMGLANITMSLDHDLGEHVMSGYDVLVWIEEQVKVHGVQPPAHIYIHTANPAAKERMRAARYSIYNNE